MSQGASSSPSVKGKRQVHAERMKAVSVRILLFTCQLSHMLSTRLRYAVFKVENGWTRQSLSEVENLFYRRQMTLSKPAMERGVSPREKGPWQASPSSPTPSPRKQEVGPLELRHDTSSYADFWHRIDTNKARASPELKDTTTQDTHVPSSASGGDAKPVPSGGKHTLDTSLSHDVTDDEPSSKRSKMHLDESVA